MVGARDWERGMGSYCLMGSFSFTGKRVLETNGVMVAQL